MFLWILTSKDWHVTAPFYTRSLAVKYFEVSQVFLWMVNFTAALITERCESLKKVAMCANNLKK